jgi:hypothetical protein
MAAIQTQTANVTSHALVTPNQPVTPKTVAAQPLSSLSPVSLVKILTIHARDKGLRTTGVTGDVVTLVTKRSVFDRWIIVRSRMATGRAGAKSLPIQKGGNRMDWHAQNFSSGGFLSGILGNQTDGKDEVIGNLQALLRI